MDRLSTEELLKRAREIFDNSEELKKMRAVHKAHYIRMNRVALFEAHKVFHRIYGKTIGLCTDEVFKFVKNDEPFKTYWVYSSECFLITEFTPILDIVKITYPKDNFIVRCL